MRRTDREIRDFDELTAIIARCDVCRLAFNDDEVPYILPLNFGEAVEDGLLRLYFHGAAEGRKYELLRRNPQVAFACDCGHRLVTDAARGYCTMEYESVIGRGRLELVPESEKEHGLSVLMAHYDRTLEWSRAARRAHLRNAADRDGDDRQAAGRRKAAAERMNSAAPQKEEPT